MRTTSLARPAVVVLGAMVVGELLTGIVASASAGSGFDQVRDSFVLTNSVIALSLAVAGGLIAWHRPRNPVGWLLLVAAVFQGGTAAAAPLTATGGVADAPLPAGSGFADVVAAYSWPWSIGLLLPLALLVFPDGTLPSRRWRPLVGLVVVAGLTFVASAGAELPGVLTTIGDVLNGAAYLAAVAALVVRYRRGDEQRRRQLLWLLLALLLMLVMLLIWVPAAEPSGQLVLILLVIPLVPAAITIAVLRHRLLDIRLVLSRTVLYGLLTAGVVAAYLGLVGVVDVVLRRDAGLGSSVLATLIIAIGFNPLRVRLQRLVDRALYGDRADPVRAVSRLGERLAGSAGASPVEALPLVREALRLPYAALHTGGVERGADGTPTERQERVALNAGGAQIGELIVGVRAGQRELGAADRAVLELLAVPLAMAVRATELSESLQRSRGEIVAAREEERRRLRRDLHDGLGPVLTGVTFQADAAGNLLRSDPDRAAELLAALRRRTAEAIADVRRLVNDLRPPALDELGLVGALRRQAEEFGGPVRVAVDAPDALPPLPAAVEVAAYRIALEGLTNAVRHAGASRVDLRIELNGALEVSVLDDGANRAGWSPGVGLTSMRERAAELGGDVRVGPVAGGGRVLARLPL